jgi:putative oxidoreductase
VTRYPPMSAAKIRVLTAYRIGVGAVLAGYGAGSLFGTGAAWLAAVELAGGALVLFGIWTRLAAFASGAIVMFAGVAMPSALGSWPVRLGGAATAVVFCGLVLISIYGPGLLTIRQLRGAVVDARIQAWLHATPPDIEQIRA